ncbi:MAG: fibrobacter succinogenes major paralogous domain-containing protein [Saprospiraceae bacterium]|nr:fibrobacter succinogenes major paralogous domain-containing protein [Saprospiraceae bacterium]
MKFKFLISFIFFAFVTSSSAQVALNIELMDGKNYIIPVAQIDSITYFQKESPCGHKIIYSGEVYPIVQIGSLCVFAENLRTSKFRNGDRIKELKTPAEFKESLDAAWAYPDFSYSNERFLGKHYNWKVVDDVRGVCPEGWKVPEIGEWKEMIEEIDLQQAGTKMKGFGFTGSQDRGWAYATPDQNSSGFTALPAGLIHPDHDPYYPGGVANFWSGTSINEQEAEYVQIYHGSPHPYFNKYIKSVAMSVRCMKLIEISGE